MKVVKEIKWVQGDQITDKCPGTLKEGNRSGPKK